MPATAAACATTSSSATAAAYSRTCHLWLDHRAKLQTGQGRAGLGRFPSPLRCRDPPPPGPGQLRVQLLLGHLVRSSAAVRHAASARCRRRREGARRPSRAAAVLAPRDQGRARLAGSADRAATLVASMVHSATAPAATGPDDIPRSRPRPAPLHPDL